MEGTLLLVSVINLLCCTVPTPETNHWFNIVTQNMYAFDKYNKSY